MSKKDKIVETENIEDTLEENEEKVEKGYTLVKDKKHKKVKVIAGITAVSVAIVGGIVVYIFKNNISVRFSKVNQVQDYYCQDDALNVTEDTSSALDNAVKTLTKIENYLEISDTLDKLYQNYKDKITNLSLGTVLVSDGEMNCLTDEEFVSLCDDLDYIANSKTEDDKYYQTVKRAVSYSSSINGWLQYHANKELYYSFLNNLQNDVANSLDVDYSKVSVDYDMDSNLISLLRNDNGENEASYNIIPKGMVINDVEETITSTYDKYYNINDYLNGNKEAKYYGHGAVLMAHDLEDYFIVYRSEEENKELKGNALVLKNLICREHKVKNAEFSYQYLIPNSNTDDVSDNYTSSAVSTMVKTLKR